MTLCRVFISVRLATGIAGEQYFHPTVVAPCVAHGIVDI
jgi:hypothetical protein